MCAGIMPRRTSASISAWSASMRSNRLSGHVARALFSRGAFCKSETSVRYPPRRETRTRMSDLSADELVHICRGPHERLVEALDSRPPHEVASEFLRLLALVRDIADLYARWSVVTLGWLHERHGLDAAAGAAAVHELWPP